jgi:hypothetical protein
MKLRASRNGTWPAGCHWITGEVRTIKVAKGVELPSWLSEAKAPTKKPAAKKDDE